MQANLRLGAAPVAKGATEPAKAELGLEPEFSMEQGIEKTLTYYRSRVGQ